MVLLLFQIQIVLHVFISRKNNSYSNEKGYPDYMCIKSMLIYMIMIKLSHDLLDFDQVGLPLISHV